MDDVAREESEEQRKQEEVEEFGERKTTSKHDPPQPSERERIGTQNDASFVDAVGAEIARKSTEDERMTVPNQLRILLDYMFTGDEKEGKPLAFVVARERAKRVCAQHRGFEAHRRKNGYAGG